MIAASSQPSRPVSAVPFVDLRAQERPIHAELVSALSEVLEGMDLLLGPNVRAFEAEFAAYCGTRYAVGVGSGTDALILALRACGIGPGDEVITAANSFVATAEAIALIGAVPIFIDVDPHTYTLDPWRLEAAITAKTRAVVPVHLYGQMADMQAIMAVAQRKGLVVVEDACQAHGARDQGWTAGNVGDAAAFSFYMSKNLGACGEAGVVTTNSRAVAAGVRRLRDHGSVRKYEHQDVGVNSRMDEIQAAILRVKLRRLDEYNVRRRAHAEAYSELLEETSAQLPTIREGATHVFHLYVVEVDGRDPIRQELADRGVATGIHYPIPIHRQRAFENVGRVASDLRVTERAVGRILSLPMYPELEPAQLEYVARSIRECLATREVCIAR